MKYGLTILCVFWSCFLLGQQLNISVNQIHEIKDLTVDNHIKCLSKDNSGNLWVGADNGLYRYNGKEVDRIDIRYVKDLLLTREGDLYVLADEGLFSISTTVFQWEVEHLIGSEGNPSDSTLSFPKTIFQDINGNIWIGENQALIRYSNGEMRRFPVAEQSVGNYLRHSFTFAEDGLGTLWTLSYGGGLFRYDQMNEAFVKMELPIELREASELSSDGEMRLWAGTISGVFEIRLTVDQAIQGIKQVSDLGKIASMSIQDEKALVASFDKGLFQFNISDYSYQKLSTFENIDILDMFLEQNQAWIAGSENIFVINSAPFYTFPQTLNQFIPTLQQAKDNSLIVNLGRKGYQARMTPDGMQFELLVDLENQLWANDMLLHQQELWMATSEGVFVYDLANQSLNRITGTNQNVWLNTISRTSEGTIWVSNEQDGPLIRINPDREVLTYPELSQIRFVLEEGATTYLAGEEGTLFLYTEQDSLQPISLSFSKDQDMPDILDMGFSRDSVFLATNRGIFSFKKVQLPDNRVDVRQVFPNPVESIAIDRQDRIWFSHREGLSQIERGGWVTFNRSQGLPSKYIIRRGLLIDAHERLWVCTSKGLATLLEEELDVYKTPQPAIVTCNVNNEEVSVKAHEIGSFYHQSAISFQFLSLIYPTNSTQYQTLLFREGTLVNQQSTEGVVTYFGLERGDYQLELRAKQTGAAWSDPAYYSFQINRKWYQTLGFQLLILLLVLASAYALFLFYNKSLRQANERLEQLVSDRTATLEDQKNQLLQTQKQILTQQKELIHKNEVLSETQKALTDSEIQFLELKREQMRRELDLKTKQLTTHALSILQKNQYLLEISKSLEELGTKKEDPEIAKSVRQIGQQIRRSIKQDDRWEEFRLYFEQVHEDFYAKLKISYPKLTNQDLKQCALVKLNLSLEDSATILGVSSESVRISRYRIQKKMGMSSQSAFYEYLVKL